MDKITFRDRVASHPNRVTMTPVSGQTNTYDVTPHNSGVVEPGTPVAAGSMNLLQTNIEAAIDDAYTELNDRIATMEKGIHLIGTAEIASTSTLTAPSTSEMVIPMSSVHASGAFEYYDNGIRIKSGTSGTLQVKLIHGSCSLYIQGNSGTKTTRLKRGATILATAASSVSQFASGSNNFSQAIYKPAYASDIFRLYHQGASGDQVSAAKLTLELYRVVE